MHKQLHMSPNSDISDAVFQSPFYRHNFCTSHYVLRLKILHSLVIIRDRVKNYKYG